MRHFPHDMFVQGIDCTILKTTTHVDDRYKREIYNEGAIPLAVENYTHEVRPATARSSGHGECARH